MMMSALVHHHQHQQRRKGHHDSHSRRVGDPNPPGSGAEGFARGDGSTPRSQRSQRRTRRCARDRRTSWETDTCSGCSNARGSFACECERNQGKDVCVCVVCVVCHWVVNRMGFISVWRTHFLPAERRGNALLVGQAAWRRHRHRMPRGHVGCEVRSEAAVRTRNNAATTCLPVPPRRITYATLARDLIRYVM